MIANNKDIKMQSFKMVGIGEISNEGDFLRKINELNLPIIKGYVFLIDGEIYITQCSPSGSLSVIKLCNDKIEKFCFYPKAKTPKGFFDYLTTFVLSRVKGFFALDNYFVYWDSTFRKTFEDFLNENRINRDLLP